MRPDEGLLAGYGFTLSGTASPAPVSALSPEGVGGLHLAVYSTVTRAFERYDTLLATGREALLLAAVVSAVLLWRTARRLGHSDEGSAVAVVLAGVPLLLSPLALLDLPAQLAVAWLSLAGWLVAPGRPRVSAVVTAALCAGVGVLLAPDTLVLLLSAGAAGSLTGVLLSRRPARLRRLLGGVLAGGLVAVLLVLGRWDPLGEQGVPGRPDRAGLLIAGALLAVVGLLAWRLLPRWRPLAVALGVAAVVAAVTGRLPTVLVSLPLAALLVAGLLERLIRPVTAGSRMVRLLAAGAAVLVLVGSSVAGARGLTRGPGADVEGAPVAQLVTWAQRQLPADARLVAGSRLWAELVHAGGDEDLVRLPGTADEGGLTAPVVRVVEGAAVPDGARVLARFGAAGAARPLMVLDESPGAPTAEELDRRRNLAAAILANPTTDAGPQATEVLRSAEIDQRLLSVLAALAAGLGVGIESFPTVAGEPPDGLARRALVDRVAGESLRPGQEPTDRLLAFLDAQLPPFAPDTVVPTVDGVLVEFRYVSAPDALVTRSAP